MQFELFMYAGIVDHHRPTKDFNARPLSFYKLAL